MSSRLAELFEDNRLVEKIKERLPHLFQLAELESARAGKVGMEVGSLRERIIVALLIYKFGEENVETEIPITRPEVDARLFGQPISIKTITGKGFSGVKLIWTVDPQKAREFHESYRPHCDMLLVQIAWNAEGGFYYIPSEVQEKAFEEMSRDMYIKLPKPGTNPRGVEITRDALIRLVRDSKSKTIAITWRKTEVDYHPYKRWVDYWKD